MRSERKQRGDPESRSQRDRRSRIRAELRERFPRHRGQLLPALHYLQHEHGYLPEHGMEAVGWYLGIPVSEVYGAATSYTELRLEQPGEHVVRVCTGVSCWINGGSELLEALDGGSGGLAGAVEETPCGFLCAMAPAVEVDGRWAGRATAESVSEMLAGSAPQ